jgi:hypothetical protein
MAAINAGDGAAEESVMGMSTSAVEDEMLHAGADRRAARAEPIFSARSEGNLVVEIAGGAGRRGAVRALAAVRIAVTAAIEEGQHALVGRQHDSVV